MLTHLPVHKTNLTFLPTSVSHYPQWKLAGEETKILIFILQIKQI
jgi:hypothetical protein